MARGHWQQRGSVPASPTATPSFIHGINPVNMATTSILICSATFQRTLWNRELGEIKEAGKKEKKKKRKKQRKDSCHSPAPWHPWSSVQGLSTEVPSTTCTMLGWPPLGWRGQEARQGPVNPRGYFTWVRPPPLDIPIHQEQNHPCAREASGSKGTARPLSPPRHLLP